MRVLVDTNIIISAMLWRGSKPAEALLHAASHHQLVLCEQTLAELRQVLQNKAPQALPDVEVFLAELAYELIPSVEHGAKLIRDAQDQPILNAAIVTNVDIIITGDKDFLSLKLDHPCCLTATQYLQAFGAMA